jgi:hypothetical protein
MQEKYRSKPPSCRSACINPTQEEHYNELRFAIMTNEEVTQEIYPHNPYTQSKERREEKKTHSCVVAGIGRERTKNHTKKLKRVSLSLGVVLFGSISCENYFFITLCVLVGISLCISINEAQFESEKKINL